MITLADFRDYIESLDVAEHYYIGKLDKKQCKSVGVYQNSTGAYRIAIGGLDNTKYEVKQISILVHWNENANETEQAALDLFYKLTEEESIELNGNKVLFMLLQTPEPIDVGMDETSKVYERVIQVDVYIERG